MDNEQAFVLAYTAALKGAITHYGAIEKEEDYVRLRAFCTRAARDAAQAFLDYRKNPKGVS